MGKNAARVTVAQRDSHDLHAGQAANKRSAKELIQAKKMVGRVLSRMTDTHRPYGSDE